MWFLRQGFCVICKMYIKNQGLRLCICSSPWNQIMPCIDNQKYSWPFHISSIAVCCVPLLFALYCNWVILGVTPCLEGPVTLDGVTWIPNIASSHCHCDAKCWKIEPWQKAYVSLLLCVWELGKAWFRFAEWFAYSIVWASVLMCLYKLLIHWWGVAPRKNLRMQMQIQTMSFPASSLQLLDPEGSPAPQPPSEGPDTWRSLCHIIRSM